MKINNNGEPQCRRSAVASTVDVNDERVPRRENYVNSRIFFGIAKDFRLRNSHKLRSKIQPHCRWSQKIKFHLTHLNNMIHFL